MKTEHQNQESFRDSIGTIDDEGKRIWIYAQKPKGKLYNWRNITSYIFLSIFFTLPFISFNGYPLFLFNVLERKFIFFSVIFWPHDFFIFGLVMIILVIFLVLFTVIFGRIFCGWACPQTIFMEMVFRKIEYWIEGDAVKQKNLDKSPRTTKKILLKTSKQFIFFVISFIISITFLSYLIGTEGVFKFFQEPVSNHTGGIISLFLFTTVFYGVFSWFREQTCLVVCPYGRLQSVLLDKNSIVVAYDYKRGEQRSKFNKNEKRTSGDCIECHQCVKVCPTGIDIRNGTQMECINCTACIDACDIIMEKVGLPPKLIRYDSENGIANNIKLRFTSRMFAYSAVLAVLMGLLTFVLITRTDLDTTIVRTPGQLYQKLSMDRTSNLYNVKLINKTHNDIPVQIKLESMDGEIEMIGKDILVKKEGFAEGEFFIILDNKNLVKRKTTLSVGIYSNNKKLKTIKTNFLSPIAR